MAKILDFIKSNYWRTAVIGYVVFKVVCMLWKKKKRTYKPR